MPNNFFKRTLLSFSDIFNAGFGVVFLVLRTLGLNLGFCSISFSCSASGLDVTASVSWSRSADSSVSSMNSSLASAGDSVLLERGINEFVLRVTLLLGFWVEFKNGLFGRLLPNLRGFSVVVVVVVVVAVVVVVVVVVVDNVVVVDIVVVVVVVGVVVVEVGAVTGSVAV